jgi:stage V sporulation protein G
MEITEVRIKLMEGSEDRLRAFCSITIDAAFVVRDLKIIDGTNGPFVAMPSRKLTGHCTKCHHKNHMRANYCNHCGHRQSGGTETFYDSPQKLYADVAHPINSECRELIQRRVVEDFQAELDRSKQPGYRSRYDDGFDEGFDEEDLIEAEIISPNQFAKPDGDGLSRDERSRDPQSAVAPDLTTRDISDESQLDTSVKVDQAQTVKKPSYLTPRPDAAPTRSAPFRSTPARSTPTRSEQTGDDPGQQDEFGQGIF